MKDADFPPLHDNPWRRPWGGDFREESPEQARKRRTAGRGLTPAARPRLHSPRRCDTVRGGPKRRQPRANIPTPPHPEGGRRPPPAPPRRRAAARPGQEGQEGQAQGTAQLLPARGRQHLAIPGRQGEGDRAHVEEQADKDTVAVLEATGADKVVSEQASQRKDGLYRFTAEGIEVTPPLCFLKLPFKAGDTWAVKSGAGGLAVEGAFTAGTRTSPCRPASTRR